MNRYTVIIGILLCILVYDIVIAAQPQKGASIDIKSIIQKKKSLNVFDDFIQCISSTSYRKNSDEHLFFHDDHTVSVPEKYGMLADTHLDNRILVLRYVKNNVHTLVFIDLIENRCIRVLTIKN